MDQEAQDKLKRKLTVTDFGQVDESKGKQLVDQVQRGEITKEEWDYLKVAIPTILNVVSAGLTTIGTITSAITNVQSEMAKVISEGIKSAKEIATSSDDVAVKMRAFDTIDSAFDKAEKMNEKNSLFGSNTVKAIALVAVLAIGALGGRVSAPKST